MATTRVKTGSSTWTQIKSLFVKTSGGWSDMSNAWVKSGSSTWTKVFTKAFVPKIASQVLITLATANSTTQTKKVTGTLYNWTNATSVQYRFRISTDGTNYYNLTNLATSTNPPSGSSNTNDTYTILQSDLTANVTNYFVYVSKATNSTYGTEAESVSDPVYIDMPRNITDLTATSASSSSISLAWTASLYAGRQMVEYKASSSSIWITSGNGAGGYNGTTTSATITGLTAGTNYDFRILPWTGTGNNTGYYGNYSNTATAYPINNNKIPPTIISATQSTPGGQLDVVVYGGSGPAYQIYWSSSPTPPSASSTPDGGADWNNGSNTTVSDPTGVPSAGTWYVYARSVTSTGFTTTDTGNTATSSYSEWSPNPGFQFTVVAPNLQTPTILSASQSGPGGTLTVNVSGGGPTWQIYWTGPSTPGNTVTPDGTSSTTTIVDNTGAPLTGTYYVYARSALTESTYGSSYSTAPSQYISSWSTGYQYVVTATRYLYYDANGGSGAPTTQTGTDSGSGATLTISNTTPTRSGYTFNGWNTNSSGTGTNYSSGASITLTSDVTLYAKWIQDNLTAPTISSISGTAGNINVYFSGGSGPYYQVYWYPTNRSDIQTVITYDANGSSSPINVTNLASPTAGATYYFWVRSVSSLTNTGTGPSVNISSWSGSSTWTAPVQAPSLNSFTISPTTPNVGTTITVSASWANSPTSVSTKITRGTANVANFETTVAGPNASTTASYTIQAADIGYYLAGFSTASNAGGTAGPSKTTSPVEIGPVVQPFVTPTWTGSFPSWTSSNFQRVTSGTANFRWGWGNGSFSWSGSTSGSGGWDFNISTTQLSTTATRSVSVTKNYTTSNDTYQTVNSTNYPYLVSSLRGDVTYSSSSRWGSIRPWINGTDNNKYTASSWSTGV
jgi:uncharacterized repeat protein (TIGR02543 family)